jgi:hypothetical protein
MDGDSNQSTNHDEETLEKEKQKAALIVTAIALASCMTPFDIPSLFDKLPDTEPKDEYQSKWRVRTHDRMPLSTVDIPPPPLILPDTPPEGTKKRRIYESIINIKSSPHKYKPGALEYMETLYRLVDTYGEDSVIFGDDSEFRVD